MDRRHHAARAAAGQLDDGQSQRQQAGEAFNGGPLFVAQMTGGSGGKDEQFGFFVMQFERVADVVLDLLAGQGDDGPAARFQPDQHGFWVFHRRRCSRK